MVRILLFCHNFLKINYVAESINFGREVLLTNGSLNSPRKPEILK